uniref:IRG-type G domain-containing protein n=1 Tax=Latimeria chalumnae TaxID=7897 RepID=H3A8X5_LATCH
GGWESVASKIQENLNSIENAKLHIAITGESGSGKSTFVNVMRGVDDEDEGAAKTGVTETTKKPTNYPHPKHPSVNLWDLPGIGTPNFKPDEYLQQVNFSQYDFFILIASERFKINHAKLACEIQKMGKKFYFVRSKVDADIDASRKRRESTFNEEKILEETRENCIDCLQKEGVESPVVYLLSSFELDKFDFQDLEETLEKELPAHKRQAFLLSLPNISINILQKKKEVLKSQIWKLATLSCGVAMIPIPGLSVACDVALLVKTLTSYCENFGLDEEALVKLAKKVDKTVEDLKSAIKSPLAQEISADVVIKLLSKAACGGLMMVDTTYYMLKTFLDELSEDAQRVLNKPSLTSVNENPLHSLKFDTHLEQPSPLNAVLFIMLKFNFFKKHMEETEEAEIITSTEVEEMKAAFALGGWESVASKIQENLDSIEKAKLHIAITGESGSGKSTFVNVMRGVDDEEEGAAKTGVTETTKKPTNYPHPKHPSVNLWDLPGIGTPDFKPDEYLQQVNFSQYDFFILIASERFKTNHAKLACEIQKMGKKFYFVHSKVDADIDASRKRRKSTFNEEKILKEIRQNCIDCLQKEGVESPNVYVLSSFELDKFDFLRLEETLEKELPAHKRQVFLLSLPNISIHILQKKKEVLKSQIWKLATLSCGIAVIPIPGLACDVAILVKTLTSYCENFGLDEKALVKLARKVNKPVEDLKSAIKSPLAQEISVDVVKKLLTKATCVIGGVAAGGISFGTTYYMLKTFLDQLSEDAKNVL